MPHRDALSAALARVAALETELRDMRLTTPDSPDDDLSDESLRMQDEVLERLDRMAAESRFARPMPPPLPSETRRDLPPVAGTIDLKPILPLTLDPSDFEETMTPGDPNRPGSLPVNCPRCGLRFAP